MEGALLFVYVQNAFSQRQSPGNVFHWDLLQVTEPMAQTDSFYTPSISTSLLRYLEKQLPLVMRGEKTPAWVPLGHMLTGDAGSHLHNSNVKTSDAA